MSGTDDRSAFPDRKRSRPFSARLSRLRKRRRVVRTIEPCQYDPTTPADLKNQGTGNGGFIRSRRLSLSISILSLLRFGALFAAGRTTADLAAAPRAAMIFRGTELLLAGSNGHGKHLSGIDSSLRGALGPVAPRPLPDHDRRGEGRNCIKPQLSWPGMSEMQKCKIQRVPHSILASPARGPSPSTSRIPRSSGVPSDVGRVEVPAANR